MVITLIIIIVEIATINDLLGCEQRVTLLNVIDDTSHDFSNEGSRGLSTDDS